MRESHWWTSCHPQSPFSPKTSQRKLPSGKRKLIRSEGQKVMSNGFRGSGVEMSVERITDADVNESWTLSPILQTLAQPQPSPPRRTMRIFSCQSGILEMLMKFWQTADNRERGDPTDKAIAFNRTSFLVCHFLPGYFMNTQTEWIDVLHTWNDKRLEGRENK